MRGRDPKEQGVVSGEPADTTLMFATTAGVIQGLARHAVEAQGPQRGPKSHLSHESICKPTLIVSAARHTFRRETGLSAGADTVCSLDAGVPLNGVTTRPVTAKAYPQ